MPHNYDKCFQFLGNSPTFFSKIIWFTYVHFTTFYFSFTYLFMYMFVHHSRLHRISDNVLYFNCGWNFLFFFTDKSMHFSNISFWFTLSPFNEFVSDSLRAYVSRQCFYWYKNTEAKTIIGHGIKSKLVEKGKKSTVYNSINVDVGSNSRLLFSFDSLFLLSDIEIMLSIEAITNLDDINLTGNSLKRNKGSLLDSEYSRISSHYSCRTEKGFVSLWYCAVYTVSPSAQLARFMFILISALSCVCCIKNGKMN